MPKTAARHMDRLSDIAAYHLAVIARQNAALPPELLAILQRPARAGVTGLQAPRVPRHDSNSGAWAE